MFEWNYSNRSQVFPGSFESNISTTFSEYSWNGDRNKLPIPFFSLTQSYISIYSFHYHPPLLLLSSIEKSQVSILHKGKGNLFFFSYSIQGIIHIRIGFFFFLNKEVAQSATTFRDLFFYKKNFIFRHIFLIFYFKRNIYTYIQVVVWCFIFGLCLPSSSKTMHPSFLCITSILNALDSILFLFSK